MIKFDFSKIKYFYVYISKITKYSIEVTMDDNGDVFQPEDLDYKIKNGKTILKIHKKVFKLFEKNNFVYEFYGKGRRACIIFYDGHILNVDAYKPTSIIQGIGENRRVITNSSLESNWESLNVGAMKKIGDLIEYENNKREVYIDGESVFFTLDDPDKEIQLNQNFKIIPVRYIRLDRMAVKVSNDILFEEVQSSNKMTDADDEKSKRGLENKNDNKSIIVLKEGFVLSYSPSFSDIMVFSPVFSQTESVSSFFDLESGHFFNLNFTLRAGRTIGNLYGYKETDYLEIPKIILDTGIINLKSDISISSKKEYPLNKEPSEVFAYLFRFFYREKNLDNYRDLVALFQTGISMNGYVKKNKFFDIFLEGKSIKDIPVKKLDIANIGYKNHESDLSFLL